MAAEWARNFMILIVNFPRVWLAGILATAFAGATADVAWAAPGIYVPDPNAKEKMKDQQMFVGLAHKDLPSAIAKDSVFQQLMGSERWEHVNRHLRTDEDDKFKAWCLTGWFEAGKFDAYRASNLAASGHVDEAIVEISKSIVAAQKSIDERKWDGKTPYNLQEYLNTRMRLFLASGRIPEALSDAEKLLSTQYKFPAAVVLLEHGKTKDAEAVFATFVNGQQSYLFESVYRYVLALSEEKNGKLGSARSDYLIAARYFAATGKEDAMKVCFESAGRCEKERPTPTKGDLTPPETNKGQLCELIKFLATEKDPFNPEKLKEALHADSFEKNSDGSFRFRMSDPRLTAINMIEVGPERNSSSKSFRLAMRLNTTDCSITQDDCRPILPTEKVAVPATKLDSKFGIIEGYKVPAGLLELTWFKGGFGSLYTVELLEGRSKHPEQAYVEWHPRTEEEWYEHIQWLLNAGKVAEAKASCSNWQTKGNSDLCMRAQAKICAAEGNFTMALSLINKAIAKEKTNKLKINPEFGDILALEKAEYLLKTHQVQASAQLFKSAIPTKMLADHYSLRAQIELAQKNYPAALADLKTASDKYFEEFRIIKRDETNKQIASLCEKLKGKEN